MWYAFEDREQKIIEHAFQTRQKTIPMLDGLHFMQTIDLSQMQKVNMKTGRGRKIRRIPYPQVSVLHTRKKGMLFRYHKMDRNS